MADNEEFGVLWHQSGVSPTGEPFVQLIKGTEIVAQMSPEMARDHARAITEAAEAAEQDAFLMDFASSSIGLSNAKAAVLLIEFRNWRAEHTGKSQGPRDRRDWVMPPPDKTVKYPDPLPNFGKRDPSK